MNFFKLKKITIAHQIARDPYVDWVVIFCSSLVLALVLVGVGIYFYLNIDARSREGKVVNGSTVVVDTKTLTKVLGQFDTRNAERTELLYGYNGPGDPSLQ